MMLRQLEYLTALAREGHFGRAAEACHVSQPALSAAIRKLEQELKVQLVRRGQRFEGFTPEGEHVLRWAQRMVAERAELDQELGRMRAGLSGVLRLGAIPTALGVASLLTGPFHAQHPRVRFTLESLSSREIVERLDDFTLDVGMTYLDREPLGRVRVVPLYPEQHVFLTPAQGSFATAGEVSWAEAAGADLALLSPDMQNRRILDAQFVQAGVTARPTVETDTVSSLFEHVVSMGLSAVIPHTWLHGFGVPEGVRVLRLPPLERAVMVGLVTAAREPGSLLAQALIEIARGLQLDALLADGLARHLSR